MAGTLCQTKRTKELGSYGILLGRLTQNIYSDLYILFLSYNLTWNFETQCNQQYGVDVL